MKQLLIILGLLLALHTSVASGQSSVSLINADKPSGGWTFGNGPEFPGAQGELRIAEEAVG